MKCPPGHIFELGRMRQEAGGGPKIGFTGSSLLPRPKQQRPHRHERKFAVPNIAGARIEQCESPSAQRRWQSLSAISLLLRQNRAAAGPCGQDITSSYCFSVAILRELRHNSRNGSGESPA